MKKLMGILLAASMVFSLAACGSTADTAASSAAGTTATAEGSSDSDNQAPDVKVGAIILGDETEGYSAAHINGIKEASGNIGQVAKIAALCGDEDAPPTGLFVTPQDIDRRVRELGRLIGYGVTLALQPGLTPEDAAALLG